MHKTSDEKFSWTDVLGFTRVFLLKVFLAIGLTTAFGIAAPHSHRFSFFYLKF